MKISIFLSSYYIHFPNEEDSYLSGPSVDMFDYLKKNSSKYNTVFFRFPLLTRLDPNTEKIIIINEIIDSSCNKEFIKFRIPYFLSKIYQIHFIIYKVLEIFFLIKYFVKKKNFFDLFIATDSIQFLTAYFSNFKNRNKIKKVYDVIDYSPRRYKSKIINFLFHFLDYLSCILSDMSVCQSDRVKRFRAKKFGNWILKKSFVKFSGIEKNLFIENYDNFNPKHFVYVGLIAPQYGIDLIIKSFEKIINFDKNIKIYLVGPIDDVCYYNNVLDLINNFNLQKNFIFTGPILDKKKVSEFITTKALGLALYKRDKSIVSTKFFGAVNKIPMYLSTSLPVLTTSIPIISKQIEKLSIGYSSSEKVDQLVNAINLYLSLPMENKIQQRKRVFNFMLDNSWDKVYDNLFYNLFNK
jgi:glycosyltransferase involved in cell wall biosynthesis